MVKKIPLTQGQYALVDDEDFDFLNQWKWYASYDKNLKGYYAQCGRSVRHLDGTRKTKIIRMHRMIMGELFGRELSVKEVIDHINHDPLDNRRSNLRVVSSRQNCQNRKRKFSSKYPGVYWDKAKKKWRAAIRINGKSKHLGNFVDEREAAKAYEQVCRELVGEELVCKSGGVV